MKTVTLKKQSNNRKTQLMFRGTPADISILFSLKPKAIVPIRHGLDVDVLECEPEKAPEGYRTVQQVAAELINYPEEVIQPLRAECFLRGNIGVNRLVNMDAIEECNLQDDVMHLCDDIDLGVEMLTVDDVW